MRRCRQCTLEMHGFQAAESCSNLLLRQAPPWGLLLPTRAKPQPLQRMVSPSPFSMHILGLVDPPTFLCQGPASWCDAASPISLDVFNLDTVLSLSAQKSIVDSGGPHFMSGQRKHIASADIQSHLHDLQPLSQDCLCLHQCLLFIFGCKPVQGLPNLYIEAPVWGKVMLLLN